jgi:hypothetical protein
MEAAIAQTGISGQCHSNCTDPADDGLRVICDARCGRIPSVNFKYKISNGELEMWQYLVRGAWCVVRGAWCVVRGAWCLVLGTWETRTAPQWGPSLPFGVCRLMFGVCRLLFGV